MKLTCQNCNCTFDCDLNDLSNYKSHYTTRGSRGTTYYMDIYCPRCDLKVLSYECSKNRCDEIKNIENKVEKKDNIEEQLAELKEYQKICKFKDFKKLKEFYEAMSKIDWANTKTITIKAEDYPSSICTYNNFSNGIIDSNGDIILNL